MKKFKLPRYTAKFLNNSFTDNNYFLRAVHVSLKYKCDSFKEGEDYPSNENYSTKRRNWEGAELPSQQVITRKLRKP